MDNGLNQNSRSGYRAKRRKTNFILNGLIVIVILLILFVAYNIFASGKDKNTTEQKTATKTEQTVKKENASELATNSKTDENSSSQDNAANNNSDEQTPANDASTKQETDNSQAVVSTGGSSSNVRRTIENPAWKPVGTSQTGEHNPSYDTNSTDWQEMLNAISYATGLEQSNMTVYWLGRDKSTANASIGTVYSKDKQQKYRVYLKWVDGEGWLPTKVEELAELE